MSIREFVVVKIGGSILRDADSYINVVEKIKRDFIDRKRIPIVVVSAMKGVTDRLLNVSRGDVNALNKVEELYASTAIRIGGDKTWRRVQDELELLRKIVTESSLSFDIKEDLILSFGERVSKILLAEAMRHKELPVLELDACNIIITDNVHGNAKILYDETKKNLSIVQGIVFNSNSIPVMEGFIGCSIKGEITTLGRGGSDYTATTIAALLSIKDVYLITDVEGVYSADPNLVPSPLVVRSMDYNEGIEAAKFGVKRFNVKMFEPLIKYYPSVIHIGNLSKFGTKIQSSSDVNMGKPKVLVYKHVNNRSIIAIIGNNVNRAKLIHETSLALNSVNVYLSGAVLPPSSPSILLLFNNKLDKQVITTLHNILIEGENV